ncbi:hypothetical protein [Chelativorans sp. Marseille-P2723]|uniref:hypothetical protein n=1 Tax=Chelativorans sp. Marseille-P2723 TaxID=2709133 RepID=UPI00157073DC|nr:hypothetical protein [Chelativorans sp. Marseille-P2723]
MHPHCSFDETPLDHIMPDNLPAVLGLRDAQIAARLTNIRLLGPMLNKQILRKLPPFTESRAETLRLFAYLMDEELESLNRLCRIMAVMINHKAIRMATSGTLLSGIASWCEDQALIRGLGDSRFPSFENLHVLTAVSADALEEYATMLKAYLIGMLPPACRERLLLKYPPGAFPEPRTFAASDPDEACILRYLMLAREHRDAAG